MPPAPQQHGIIGGPGLRTVGVGQPGIGGQVQPGRAPLDPCQDDLPDRIKADGAELDGLAHRGGDHLLGGDLQQPQHLDELALAAVAHARLQQVAQVLEGRRQRPALQRRRLVQRARLGLEQRQVVQRVVDELAMAIAAGMAGDRLTLAQDQHRLDEALHQHRLEAIAPSAPSSRCRGSGPAPSTTPARCVVSHGSSATPGKDRSAARSATRRSPIVSA